MSRLATMSRFAEPEDQEPEVLAYCERCTEELVEGAEVVKCQEEYFCDMDCLSRYYDIKEITMGDE